MKRKQNFQNIIEMLKTKKKIYLSNRAVQKYLPLAYMELYDIVYAWQKNYLLQNMTSRPIGKQSLAYDHKLYRNVPIALNQYWDIFTNCLNIKSNQLSSSMEIVKEEEITDKNNRDTAISFCN